MQSSTKPESIVFHRCWDCGQWMAFVVLTRTHLIVGQTSTAGEAEFIGAIRDAVESWKDLAVVARKFATLGNYPNCIPLKCLQSIELMDPERTSDVIIHHTSPQKPAEVQKYQVYFDNQDDRSSLLESLKSLAKKHDECDIKIGFWDHRFLDIGLGLSILGLCVCGLSFMGKSSSYQPRGLLKKMMADVVNIIGPTATLTIGICITTPALGWWIYNYLFRGTGKSYTFEFASEPKTDFRKWYQRIKKGSADTYGFLDLPRFESNLELIKTHARQRIKFADTWVRQNTNDAHADKLLQSLKAAATKLLKPDLKAAYDQQLKQKQASSSQSR